LLLELLDLFSERLGLLRGERLYLRFLGRETRHLQLKAAVLRLQLPDHRHQ
jgi:hypothetical protein